jgi:hypothetical protein
VREQTLIYLNNTIFSLHWLDKLTKINYIFLTLDEKSILSLKTDEEIITKLVYICPDL